ncbi:hypothetical protein J1N35_013720 [Gossypium stocksii]|uniref:Protein kinase domain-containing protein n=1 Tax=Gossypium stocksii TaxID=47602 RepID=A0A9D4A8M6_9ROSI|nr:hypothetical protein J1N35_013720 [Gossypium stocksii]
MGLIRSVLLMQLMIFLNVILTVKASTPAVAKPGCQSRCGDVIIPYPFGTGGDCNITEQFLITCYLGQRYATGCLSLCNNITDVSNGSCSGIGCCQTSIPKGVMSYNITIESYENHVDVLPENPCSFAFVAENDNYTFSASVLRGSNFKDKQFPVTVDWTIGTTSCKEAKMDTKNFACQENSNCVDSENNSGYFCKCFEGYEGSPYLPNGCQGDGWKNGTGCSLPNKDKSKRSPLIDIALGTSIGFLGLLLGIVSLCWMLRQRQISKLKDAYFLQNGGILLLEELSKRQGYREDVKVFTAEEHEKATNIFHESRILGQGGQGTVYKGILADNRIVAVEFFTQTHLRIATETAEALSYLHSAASIPIIHLDIKLANILLDENHTAKVFDFGASRLIPSDQAQITIIVQGTFGCLDPEYMLTSLLIEKSNVYSFRVVLIEMLTGKKVVCFKRSEESRVLAMYFVSWMKENRLLDILDPRVLNDENVEQLKEVATLACRCVRVKGEERPTMKEVTHELAGLQAIPKHPWSKINLAGEESEYLLGKFPSTYDDGVTSSSMGIGYDSINNKITFELKGAR